jgi:hypothetical protein
MAANKRKRKTPKDWRRELRRHPMVIEMERRMRTRRRGLEKDPQFLLETERLQSQFENALGQYPKSLGEFFRQFSYPIGARLGRLENFFTSPDNEPLKALLKRYVKYVARFGVVFRLRKGRPHFPWELQVPWGSKFHVRLVNEHFEPATGYPGGDAPYEDFFESERLEVLPVLQKHIASGKAKFVRIDDESLSSVLSKLEDFAYYAEGLTFVLHNAQQPYLLCLIGEKVPR